ncbi:SDR family NAD(P)-dependent oxidoreductase [Novosphingobium mangrovi (ex Hu et al. 2023)]|uniref:SDR family oxidoreductase n=1 Tax=Novosphingobium mangrovi (ex Hu et al. 2023) TaxID=2930094 RepID=A0ABT0AID0_9SPHN|nr:SDR family NAD(P)-dependent oxidoreductase [Novosphingobium mangrovi (ex Hu et al. 2023)]MCJ1962951.1 SDR family oxidoreductase [Novosphingobium mangrovi (ex Hu et al. 2023)]
MKTLDQFDIAGRSGLVTGAASGLGLAYAEVLCEAGAQVTLTDFDGDGAEREAARLREEGYAARAARADVSDLAEVAAAFDDHVAAFGGCDIVFSNAGYDAGNGFWTPEDTRNPQGQLDVYDPAAWERSIQVNLTGQFHTLREAARVMKRNEERSGRRGGSIVCTSSNAAVVNEAIVGVPYMPAKAGVMHFMRHAALELAAFGIRVNAIAPGPFVTNIGGGWLKKNPEARKAWDKLVPTGAVGEVHQIKPLALLLASDAGSYMTGAHVMIDGGMQLGPVKPLAGL